ELLAWLEVEVLLAGDQIEDIFVLDEIERVAPACQAQQFPLVPQPARVVDQVSDRDGHAEVWQLTNVLADFVVEGDLSFLRQQDDDRRRELLGNGRDVED